MPRIGFWRVFSACLLMALALIPSFTSQSASADSPSAAFPWAMTLTYPRGAGSNPRAAALSEGLPEHLRGRVSGMQVVFTESPVDGGYRLSFSGTQGTDQLRRLLHEGVDQAFNPVLSASDLALSGAVTRGETITLALDANLSTGYNWQVTGDGDLLEPAGEPVYEAVSNRSGAPFKMVLTFRALGDGDAALRLTYRRPFQLDEPPAMRLDLRAARLASFSDLTNPFLTEDLALPLRADRPAPFDLHQAASGSASAQDLPAAFSWKDQGKVTPVKDQMSCGSCWAFATVAPLESAILIKDGVSTDLSEQYLISCNYDNWNCARGGIEAHAYHMDDGARLMTERDSGAVLEGAFPYQSYDWSSAVPCGPAHEHPYKIASWFYLSASSMNYKIEDVKQALLTYGPVDISVCAGYAFQDYTGGVLTTDESTLCGPAMVNHDVTLVGWDDAAGGPGEGAWIIKNSWGPGWGEGGYIRLKYGISNIGYWMSAVDYEGAPVAPAVPVPSAPAAFSRLPASSAVTFSFAPSEDAAGYWVEVTGPAGPASAVVDSGWIQSTTYTVGSFTPGLYAWRVKARSEGGLESDFSASLSFTIAGAPTAPSILSPLDGRVLPVGIPARISWQPVPDATQYRLKFWQEGGEQVDSGWITGSQFTTVLHTPGDWVVMIRSKNEFSESAYGQPVTFTAFAPRLVWLPEVQAP